FLITHGDSIKEDVAPIPEQHQAAVKAMTGSDTKLGYCYSYFGLFWIDLWTWNGYHCLYKDRTVWRLESPQVAELLQVREDQLKKPLTYSYPPLLIIALLIGAVMLWGYVMVKLDERKGAALLKDVRYVRALEILKDTPGEGRPAGLEAAVQYL